LRSTGSVVGLYLSVTFLNSTTPSDGQSSANATWLSEAS
jgi:hypothetical protein